MHPETEDTQKKYEKWLKTKADLFEEIEIYEQELASLKVELKAADKHITMEEMDEKDRFNRLLPGRKRLVDAVRMIAYRAETAMAGMLKNTTVDIPAARKLLQDLFVTEADIIPDKDSKQLVVRVHNASRPAANRSLSQLLTHLNEAQISYPGTDMRIVYQIGRNIKKNAGDGVT